MQIFNVHQAKTQFSKLLDQVLAGDEVVIARNGKPVAKLSALGNALPERMPGALKGKIWIADDFDAPDEELERLFYGSSDTENTPGQ